MSTSQLSGQDCQKFERSAILNILTECQSVKIGFFLEHHSATQTLFLVLPSTIRQYKLQQTSAT